MTRAQAEASASQRSERDTLDCFFHPRSVVVVGASRDPRKLGYIILDNLLRGRFPGAVYAVNLNAARVLSVPAYESVSAVPGVIDLAIIVVPAPCVPDVIADCARKGVKAAVIISAGFREAGPEGQAIEDETLKRARAARIRILGPNSVGVINTFARLNATFAESQPLSYEVAVVSQSGAVATAFLDWARSLGVGFSKFVSLGNTIDVDEVDLLEHLAHDDETKLIVLYLEGIRDGRRLIHAARYVTRDKPIIAMKVGRSLSGARAAMSHTGSLASSDAVVDGAFRQVGIVRAYAMDELFDYTLAFAYLPLPRGPRIAIVTNAGGPGVMAADAIERFGLQLARLSSETTSRLHDALPTAASVANPIDILGDAGSGRYQRAIDVVIADPSVDGLIVLLTPQAVTEPEQTARSLAHVARTSDKPVMAVYMGGEAVARGRQMLDIAQVPAFPFPERAVRTMAALYERRKYVEAAEA